MYHWLISTVSQVLTTLLGAGFEILQLGESNVEKIGNYLQDLFQKQNGLLGFGKLGPPCLLVAS